MCIAEMENAPYLIEGGDRRTSNLVRGWSTMTGITDVRWPHSLKVKVIRSGRQSDTCLPITRPRKVTKTHQNWQASCPCHCWHSSPVPRSGSPGRLTLWPKISHIFGTERPTNFKLGILMEYDDPRHRHARSPRTHVMEHDLHYCHGQWPQSWKLWLAVQVTTYRGRGHILWRLHYRPHSLCEGEITVT